MGLFGKDTKDEPRDQVRKWSSALRKQKYQLDRNIKAIQREEAKIKISLKETAKKGDRDACLVLARSLIHSKKAIERLEVSKAQMESVRLHMNQQLANIKVAGAIQKSADVMKVMQNLVKVHEVSQAMNELAKEMMKAGIMEELMEETVEDAVNIDEEDMEDEVKAEVDRIMSEITSTASKPAAIATKTKEKDNVAARNESESDEEEITEMQKRLQALRS